MIEKIYRISPVFIQSLMISIFNFISYRKRYGGKYNFYRKLYQENIYKTLEELKIIQKHRYFQFVSYVINNSKYYKKVLENIKDPEKIENIKLLPVINKEQIRKNIKNIYTIKKSKGIVSKTGGTTGKSLEVIFTKNDMQERFAFLDNFRSFYGYKLGKKTAWFSGKALLTEKDLKKNRFWKTDFIYKVRYYSTFHINEKYLYYYLQNLINYKPEFMVGFPSSMIEIAKYGIRNNIDFPQGVIKAIFPTAETLTPEIRQTLSTYFKTEIYDQYASSEGAPFIFECKNHNLHLELQSGVFEVLDENNQPAKSGRLVVTSFTTHGTPLIRYDIGDRITLSDKTCNCGNNNPLVEKIEGRIDDYIFSEETGKINLGNISNVLKGVYGVVKFQVIQNKIDEIDVFVEIDKKGFDDKSRKKFISNWRERIGNKMKLNILEVESISVESSGKFRIVKNNIKHLIYE